MPEDVAVIVDPTTRRSDRDALQGHRCVIDLSVEEALAGVRAGVGDDASRYGAAAAGVFTSVAQAGEDGYPQTVIVMVDGGACVVPYAAISPAPAGVTQLG